MNSRPTGDKRRPCLRNQADINHGVLPPVVDTGPTGLGAGSVRHSSPGRKGLCAAVRPGVLGHSLVSAVGRSLWVRGARGLGTALVGWVGWKQ